MTESFSLENINISDNLHVYNPSTTHLRAGFGLQELLETVSNIWPRFADLAWNIKYVPMRLNPRLNKKSET